MPEHRYNALVEWTNADPNTPMTARSYSRNHTVTISDKPALTMSADPSFRGDNTLYNPEEMLLAATASCHMLSYLFRCAQNNITIVSYTDKAVGTMQVDGNGGRFTGIALFPVVTIKESDLVDKATELHRQANKDCFIANSLNFEIKHNAVVKAVSVNAQHD
ncbi:MAG TPA: OsmC family protein [Chitinophagales bacterium]|nr:OsmC family protein [Chitinophagales bacterium]